MLVLEICSTCGCLHWNWEFAHLGIVQCDSCHQAAKQVRWERIYNFDYGQLERRMVGLIGNSIPRRAGFRMANYLVQSAAAEKMVGTVTGRLTHHDPVMHELSLGPLHFPQVCIVSIDECELGPAIVENLTFGVTELAASYRMLGGQALAASSRIQQFGMLYGLQNKSLSKIMNAFDEDWMTPVEEPDIISDPDNKWWDGKSRRHASGSGFDFRKRDRARQKRQRRKKC